MSGASSPGRQVDPGRDRGRRPNRQAGASAAPEPVCQPDTGRPGRVRPRLLRRVPADVRVGYEYDAEYQQLAEWCSSWARVYGIPVTTNGSRQSVTLFTEAKTMIGAIDARGSGLGGWTLSPDHAYDPVGRTLFMGDGTRREADAQGTTALEHVAESLSDRTASPSAPTGASTSLTRPTSASGASRRTGTASNVAGTGVFGLSGEGGPASAARLASPEDIARGERRKPADRDSKNNRIRWVALGGRSRCWPAGAARRTASAMTGRRPAPGSRTRPGSPRKPMGRSTSLTARITASGWSPRRRYHDGGRRAGARLER